MPNPTGRHAALAEAPAPCAHCGALLRLDSRAFAPVEYEDGLVCPACDEAAMASALYRAQRPAAVENLLRRSAAKAAARRFTGEPITGFGALAL